MNNMNRIFNDPGYVALPGSLDKVWDTFFESSNLNGNRGLSYEIKSEEEAVVAEVEVPGVDPKDVKVRVEGRAIHVETPRGNAYFTIGARVNQDGVTASVRHGLLTLRVPKREAKKVEVTVEDNGG